MPDCKVEVDPGVCKMHTVIVAKMGEDMMSVVFEVESDCPHVKKMAQSLEPVEPYSNVGGPIDKNPIYTCAGANLPHSACPVPCAFVKGMEVASDLGLMRDVNIKITKL